ncbi:MAG: hypothetical protein KJ051_11195 [Thermoleophilia bacterium]|nr:hypothetical protein [Thermoleophilia bacterium]
MIACAPVAAPARRVEEPVRLADREYPYLVELEIGVLAPIGECVELAPLVPKLAGRAWSGRARRGQVGTRAGQDPLLRENPRGRLRGRDAVACTY